MIKTFNAIIDMDLPSNEKALMLTILRHVNHQTGLCYPSVETLMKKSGIKSKTTFLKVRKNLVEKGLLQYNQRGKNLFYMITLPSTKSNQYAINEPVQNSNRTSTDFDLNQSNSRPQTINKQKNNKLNINNSELAFITSKDNPNYDYLHNFGWQYSELSSEFIC